MAASARVSDLLRICYTFAMHLLRICGTSPGQLHLNYCLAREAAGFDFWYERDWDGPTQCAAAAALVAPQNPVACGVGQYGCETDQ